MCASSARTVSDAAATRTLDSVTAAFDNLFPTPHRVFLVASSPNMPIHVNRINTSRVRASDRQHVRSSGLSVLSSSLISSCSSPPSLPHCQTAGLFLPTQRHNGRHRSRKVAVSPCWRNSMGPRRSPLSFQRAACPASYALERLNVHSQCTLPPRGRPCRCPSYPVPHRVSHDNHQNYFGLRQSSKRLTILFFPQIFRY